MYINIIGTFLLLSIFILSSINKMFNLIGTANYLKYGIESNLSLNYYVVVIVLVIILQLVGSSIIIYSTITDEFSELSYYIILGLIAFTIVATAIFHNPLGKGNYLDFIKNISLLGGLTLLLDRFNK